MHPAPPYISHTAAPQPPANDSASQYKAALEVIIVLIGNVDHSEGNGANSARMRGVLLNDIRTIANKALGKE